MRSKGGTYMELILIRHGESIGNINHLVYGQTDYKMTEKGYSQIPYILKALKPFTITQVYSSPLLRAKHIADAVGEAFEVDVIADDRLMEIDFGIYEDTYNKKLMEELGEQYYELIGFFDHMAIPEGEHQDDFLARVRAFIDELLSGADGTYVIASHFGVIKAILNHLMGYDKLQLRQLAIKPGALVKLSIKKDRVRLDELIQTFDKA